MISSTDIIVQGTIVADVETVLSTDVRVIENLKANLLQHASQIWDQESVNSDEGTEITILADKEIPYRLLKRIMQTLSETPFKKISLAVSKKAVEKNP